MMKPMKNASDYRPHRHACWMVTWATVLVTIAALPDIGRAQDRPRDMAAPGGQTAAIFTPLKVGQKVNLEERPGGQFDVLLLNDGTVGAHTVLEVGAAHLLMEDIAVVSRRWIPVTSIRAVIWTSVPGR